MRAVVRRRYGPPDVLRLADVPTPVPHANEVLIRIRATAVTSSDCYVRGLRLSPTYRLLARVALGWRGPRQPILGMVLAGEVASVGPDVRSYGVGDRVFGFDRHRFGTYAQFASWPEDRVLTRTPVSVTDVEAAAITYGGLLALHLLRKANIRAGQRVLVYGASGAVGSSAVQQVRRAGAHVTGVCGTTNMDLVASLGASTVVDYTVEDFREGSERYDVVLDTVGKLRAPPRCGDAAAYWPLAVPASPSTMGHRNCAVMTLSCLPILPRRGRSTPSSTAPIHSRTSSTRTPTWTAGTSAATWSSP